MLHRLGEKTWDEDLRTRVFQLLDRRYWGFLEADGELIGQGREAAKKALAEKPELAKKIVEAIHAKRAAVAAAAAAK